ncbi:MAG: hypothetical protein IT353_08625 [Gemmatimonadaceae bacterium]|nr:hypothetical protein [Gemmatimonadaceae bacterium]
MPRRMLTTARHSAILGLALIGLSTLTACGKTLGTLVTESMDGCIAARNAAFVGGAGTTALNTPLPDSVVAVAKRIAYQRTLANYELIAESAANQVTLVCALELASYYKNGDVAVALWKYTKHPDAAVAVNAKKLLLSTQDPLPGNFSLE